ncbi:hypothetical protein HDU91_002904, partial [Kappamyces sp. JEL0680]
MSAVVSDIDPNSLALFQGTAIGFNLVGVALCISSIVGLFRSRASRSAGDFYLSANLCISNILLCVVLLVTETTSFTIPLGTNPTLCRLQGIL